MGKIILAPDFGRAFKPEPPHPTDASVARAVAVVVRTNAALKGQIAQMQAGIDAAAVENGAMLLLLKLAKDVLLDAPPLSAQGKALLGVLESMTFPDAN